VSRIEGSEPSQQCRVRVLTTLVELDSVADEWRGLWGKCVGLRTPYLSFEWVRTWAVQFRADGRLRILIAENGAEIIGIMPLVLTQYRLWPLTLEALETVGGESRNVIALVTSELLATVTQAFSAYLVELLSSSRCVLRLWLVPAENPTLKALVAAFAQSGTRTRMQVRVCSFAPYVHLPLVWEQFLLSLDRNRRKSLHRAQKRLDREQREVMLRNCAGDEVEASMLRLFQLHEARWDKASVRGVFHDARNRAFHLEMAQQCDRMGMLDLSELLIDGTTVSVQFACVLDGVAYLMRSGRDTSFAIYDVGHLHSLRLFRKWLAEQRYEADFLRGAEPYKFYWTRRYRVYSELLVMAVTDRGGLPLRLAYAWMRLARFVSHRHPPREIIAYLRMQRATRRGLSQMGIRLNHGRHDGGSPCGNARRRDMGRM